MIYTNKYEKINALSNTCIEYDFFYFFFRIICQNPYVVSHKNTHLLDVLNVILNLPWFMVGLAIRGVMVVIDTR